MPRVTVAGKRTGSFLATSRNRRLPLSAIPGAPLRYERKDTSAQHEIHGDNVEEERHHQQQLEDPIGRGQRVRVQGRNHVGRRHHSVSSLRGVAGPLRAALRIDPLRQRNALRFRKLQVRHERKQAR